MSNHTAPERSGGSLDAVLQRLLGLHPKSIDLSLERIDRLLVKLGSPHERVAPIIHIAGTNGKGSTSAFCRAILEAAGQTVHVYTSPHLCRFNERIRLAGALVSDEALIAALARCEEVNAGAPITFFEITTAAAFLLFSQTPADALILEVGLGGRLDTTNVITSPAVSVITPIGLDHQAYLGDTLALIAAEKAGILKRGRPAIIAQQEDEALAVIERAAARLSAPLRISGQQWTSAEESGRLVLHHEDGLLDLPAPRLVGRHQFENAGAALMAVRAFMPTIAHTALEQGLAGVDWPARLQRLSAGPLLAHLPEGAELWLDGGHNPHAGRALATALADLEERVPKPLLLICGMLSTKDAAGFFVPFSGLARKVLTLTIPDEALAMSAHDLAAAARLAGLDASPCDTLDQALQATAGSADGPRILVCGSLYLAGKVLTRNAMAPR